MHLWSHGGRENGGEEGGKGGGNSGNTDRQTLKIRAEDCKTQTSVTIGVKWPRKGELMSVEGRGG